MSQIIIVKITQATCAGTTVESIGLKRESSMSGCHGEMMAFESKLSGLLLNYNRQHVYLNYKFFNNMSALEQEFEKATRNKKEVRVNRLFGRLDVSHYNRSTDLDEWFESKVSLEVLETNRKGKAKNINKPLSDVDFNELCSSKEGKILFLEIRHA